ncbi:MAG: cytochrome b/b6 domain-containing protein [Steroidobacteraceae bacterium]
MNDSDQKTANLILVWDLAVRVIHWGLVVSVFGAWLTRELEGDWFAWHTRFGYAVLVLALTRVVWGVVGTRYARFTHFVRGPSTILNYLKNLRVSRSSADTRDLGHNPLGAVMIVVLLSLLLMQAVTGLFANDQILETGPLFGYVSVALSDQLTTVHKQLFDVLWAAISLHVLAVFFYLWVLRQNLVKPMWSGRKPGVASDGITHSRTGWAVVIALVVSSLLALLVVTAPEAFLFDF